MTNRQRRTYQFYFFFGLLLAGLFAYGWFRGTRLPYHFHGHAHIIDVLAFLALSFVVWQRTLMDLFSWFVGRHIKDPKPSRPKPGLKVAFITTFVPSVESIDTLRDTLKAITKVNYDHDTWLLDEGNDPRAKALCRRLGVNYFSRKDVRAYNTDGGKFATRTKGGNHNAWYHAHGHQYDFVAQLDTDFQPSKQFLTATLGYFRDPAVAFVGTPQIYGNTKSSWIARGAAEQTYGFYGPTMRGLATRESTLMIGANHVIRVAALKDIDFYRAHLTEDLLTGMVLHTSRWKSVYVPKALAIGEGPTTWRAYFNQQTRWASGCIDIFFHHFPSMMRDMSARQAFYYMCLQQFYFNGLAYILGVGLLVLYFTTGYQSVDINLKQLVAWGAPIYLWRNIFNLWLQRFNIRPRQEHGLLFAGRLITIAVLPIYFLAFLGVLMGKRLSFKVTPKGSKQESAATADIFVPHLLLAVVSLGGIELAELRHHTAAIMLLWGAANIVTLLSFYVIFRLKPAIPPLFKRRHRQPARGLVLEEAPEF